MLIGMAVVSSGAIVASGGIIAIILCLVVGLGLGNVLGKRINKDYKGMADKMTAPARICFRAWALISQFSVLKKKYEKDVLVKIIETVVYEGKRALNVKDANMTGTLEK